MVVDDCMVYGEEIFALFHLARHKRVLEIGAYKGGSTAILACAARHVCSVDTFMCDHVPGAEHQSTLAAWMKAVEPFGNCDCIVGNSQDSNVHMKLNRNWDVLFIDADHSYKGCLADLTHYVPYVVDGGVVALHDYSMQFGGVIAAAQNYFKRRPDNVEGSIAIYYLKSFENF